jgi:hypothetical protein
MFQKVLADNKNLKTITHKFLEVGPLTWHVMEYTDRLKRRKEKMNYRFHIHTMW